MLGARSISTRTVRAYVAVAVFALLVSACASPPPGGTFVDEVVFSGLIEPTNVAFARDGRVFVAEKRGIVKVFDSLTDPSPQTFVDLRTEVYNFWDRGLLGLALHPDFPATPWVYLLYSRDADVGGVAPKWGTADTNSDPCPTPPGETADGCVTSGRLVRVRAAGNISTGAPQVLLDGWCQQFPSHSIGDIAFGRDGALYVSGGEGAEFGSTIDYGQSGSPKNPCGDPPVGVGGIQTPPTAEGGALRAQDLRTPGDPTGFSGAILRINPDTGEAMPDNPLASSSDANARRIIAYGMRNPFRFTLRPGSDELWVGDVGWKKWEELNRVARVNDSVVENFGWPCYEGRLRQAQWDNGNLAICENLYAAGATAVTEPRLQYPHVGGVVSGESCRDETGSTTGLAFVPTNNIAYPASYRGGLFFADYSRRCIYFAPPLSSGQPDFTQRQVFRSNVPGPVDLEVGPGGNLYYVTLEQGAVRRITYNAPPRAVVVANPSFGPVPLQVELDASGSSDPTAGGLTFAWDLDDDGAYDDSTAAKPSVTFAESRDYTVRVRVTDSRGLTGTATGVVSAGDTPPIPAIDLPGAETNWRVGDTIAFQGGASDTEQGPLPPSALSWGLVMSHCPGSCHDHPIQTFDGVASGSFVAPDHEYPSHLVLRLTATDSRGLKATTSLELNPQIATVTVESVPAGIVLGAGSLVQPAPFSQPFISGSTLSVSATSPQVVGGQQYVFQAWSDGGAATHDVVASDATTLTATYVPG